jgi:hypothetical protein
MQLALHGAHGKRHLHLLAETGYSGKPQFLGTVKPFRVALVEPVAYPKSELVTGARTLYAWELTPGLLNFAEKGRSLRRQAWTEECQVNREARLDTVTHENSVCILRSLE